MKNKLIITLLALTTTAAMLAGCGKETAEVQSADTETVAEVNTETETVAAETETEESTEGAELVLNTETTEKAEVAATGDKNTGTNKKSDTKSETKKTDSTKTETKADSTKNDSATQAPAETTTNTPAQTPAETPAEPTVSDQPTTGPQPTTAKCPYTVNTWMDLGDGWWGCYFGGVVSMTPAERANVDNETQTWFTNKMENENLTYDNSASEYIGNYSDVVSVNFVKYHLVPAPEGAYDAPQE